MTSLVTQIIKKVFLKDFSEHFTIEGVYTPEDAPLLFAIQKKTGNAYFIPLHKKDNKTFAFSKKVRAYFLDIEGTQERLEKCSDFRFIFERGFHIVTYVRPAVGRGTEIVIAKSKDLKTWKISSIENDVKEAGCFLPLHEHENEKLLIFGGESIGLATSSNLRHWKIKDAKIAEKRTNFFDDKKMNVLAVEANKQGLLVIYETAKIVDATHEKEIRVGALILAKANPTHILWRCENPYWEFSFPWSKYPGIKFVGSSFGEHDVKMYYATNKGAILTFSFAYPFSKEHRHVPAVAKGLTLEKHHANPIISPNSLNQWETVATFNTTALHDRDTVHFLYRAVGSDDISLLGYASSKDGFFIDEKLTEPAYIHKKSYPADSSTANALTSTEKSAAAYGSGGGGNGGCEDPRLTLIDGRVYLLYTAFDGWSSIRINLSSISLEDFREKRWNWRKAVPISPPGQIHKNWVIFPEKINGKYAVLHGISPKVLIDYFDSLDDFDGNNYIESQPPRGGRKDFWDNKMRGVGPTPIKTSKGWLVFYHAMDSYDPNKYKIGAMILDLNDPTKILARSRAPILEPDKSYENDGLKSGVVYTCGAIVKDGKLFVYYGGSDTVVCVATTLLEPFVETLLNDKTTANPFATLKVS
ncbi:MAG: hypothetical protein WCP15_03445 [bacterium]